MKVGLAQINTTVGDLEGNRHCIVDAYRRLVRDGAELVVFPELAICGYPPRDLLFKARFVPDNLASLHQIAAETTDVPMLVGFVAANAGETGRPFHNAAAWCVGGEVSHVAHKCLLPTYDVFDEDRYFEPGREPLVVRHAGWRIGITVCEDIWTGPDVETARYYVRNPLKTLHQRGLDLLVNLSASPWHSGKDGSRRRIVHAAAREAGVPVVYVNAVGGNDELIFDGHSMVMTPQGKMLTGLAPFAEDFRIADLRAGQGLTHDAFERDRMADIHDALVLGLRDYTVKSGFSKVLLGLSGGIDSALTAVLAAEAVGPENVIGVSLPSAISSGHSVEDARKLAGNLGIGFHVIGIQEVADAAIAALRPLFDGRAADVTEENIQARARGLLLMGISNKFGALLLTTGNKSELAVGYCTLYGDMAGGLAVISDLAKTQVYALSRWINRESERIPWNTIHKAPSAELRPDQKDEDSLPPYEVLDEILQMYVEQRKSSADIIALGHDESVVRDVVRMVDLNEYKRKQAAPGLKITPLAFGTGRRIPIVQKYVS